MNLRFLGLIVLMMLMAIGWLGTAIGATPASPAISIQLGEAGGAGPSVAMQIVMLLTVLSLAPALFVMVTSFTRIVIVLAFLRQALGTQQVPPTQVLVGLAMFLTFFIMSPVWDRIHADALQPYFDQKISQEEALGLASKPLRQFMLKQTREKDLALFVRIAKLGAAEECRGASDSHRDSGVHRRGIADSLSDRLCDRHPIHDRGYGGG